MAGAGVAADVGEAVHRLQGLARPAVLHRAHVEPLARVVQQRLVARLGVLLLADLVVLAADEHHVAAARALAADVVVRVLVVPEEARRAPARDPAAEDVGAVLRDLGLDRLVAQRGVRGQQDVARGDGAAGGHDAARLAVLHLERQRVLEHVAAAAGDAGGLGQQVAADVELRLVVEAQPARGREGQRDVLHQLGGEAEGARRLLLLAQGGQAVAALRVRVAGHALEVAGQLPPAHRGRDVLDGGAGGLRGRAAPRRPRRSR